MFKKGFTLAEVLITLMIIGVVSVLTVPSLIQNTNKSQLEPKKNKIISALTQANKQLMYSKNVDTIIDAGYYDGNYINELSDFLKISGEYALINNQKIIITAANKDMITKDPDLIWYILSDGTAFNLGRPITNPDTTKPPHKVPITHVQVDINAGNGPNIVGKDKFVGISMYNDGSIKKTE